MDFGRGGKPHAFTNTNFDNDTGDRYGNRDYDNTHGQRAPPSYDNPKENGSTPGFDGQNNNYRRVFRPDNNMNDIERKEKLLINNIGMLNDNLDIQKEILGSHVSNVAATRNGQAKTFNNNNPGQNFKNANQINNRPDQQGYDAGARQRAQADNYAKSEKGLGQARINNQKGGDCGSFNPNQNNYAGNNNDPSGRDKGFGVGHPPRQAMSNNARNNQYGGNNNDFGRNDG